jgi:signal transduction histidine kinase
MPHWSIRKKLHVLLLVLFLPAFGVVVYSGINQRQSKMEEARKNALLLVSSLTAQQEQIANSTRTMLTLLAQLPEVRYTNAAKCDQLFADIHRRFPYYTVLLAVTPDGYAFASSMPIKPGTIYLGDRKHVQDAIRTRDFSVGEYIVGRISNARSINYTYPAYDDHGNLAAVVIAGFNLDEFSRFLSKVQIDPGTAVAITDWRGTRLFRSPETSTVTAGVPLPSDVFRIIAGSSREGTFRRVAQDGVARTYAYTQLRLKDQSAPYMFMLTGVAEEPIARSADFLMVKNLAILGIALLLAAGAIWFFADSILIQPVNRLVDATRLFAAGASIVRTGLPHAPDELGQLAQSFDEAMELLELRDRERKEAERALQLVHTETELFLMCIPSILIGLDAEGRITRWNTAAATTFAIESRDAVGRKLEDCGIEWVQPEMHRELGHWLAANGSVSQEFKFRKSEAETRFLDIRIQPILGPQGGPDGGPEVACGVILTGNDVTHCRFLEDQLHQAQKLEAVGQLAAGIAHEINTPLQYVGDNVRFFKDSWSNVTHLLDLVGIFLDESAHASKAGGMATPAAGDLHAAWQNSDTDYLMAETSGAIDQTLGGLERISNIVRAMKEFSHPGCKEMDLVDINHAISITATVARNEWKYVAEMITQFEPNLTPVLCHTGELNQVLLNLIVNASQAIADNPSRGPTEKGTITISTKQLPGAVLISIQDTGAGIPESIRSRVFEPFFTTKPPGKGTGQGLALAHSVVAQQHHGQIWFDSKIGVGTTFFIQLPIPK